MLRTRAEAKAQGLKRYFTGKPCKHGHVCERWVRSAHCTKCELEYEHLYRQKYPDRFRVKNRQQYLRNGSRRKSRAAKIRDMLVILQQEMPDLLAEFGL